MKEMVCFLSLLLMSSCVEEQTRYVQPISFANEAPIRLNVATIEVVDEYVPPMHLPNVDHAVPTPPNKAIRLWSNERLQAIGTGGYARVTIKDAHILQQASGKQVEYNGRIDVSIEAYSADRSQTSNAEVTVQRSMTTDEDTSLEDKEMVWDNLVREMMNDYDTGMTGAIASNLTQFLGQAPVQITQ